MTNEFRIVITDETKDGNLSNINVEQQAITPAVQPNTVKAVNKSVNKVSTNDAQFTGLGKNALDTMTGGLYSRGEGLISSFANPATLALATATTALTIANKLYEVWKERQREENEREANQLRAGGNRGNVNMYNARVHAITGRTVGGSQTIYRR